MFDIVVANVHIEELSKPPTVNQKTTNNNFDPQKNKSKIDTIVHNLDKEFYDNIISAVNINNAYHQCLSQIVNTEEFKSINKVRARVASTLKKEKKPDVVGSKLIASYKSHLKNIGTISGTKLQDEFAENFALLNNKTKLDDLKKELEIKNSELKNYENSIKILKKENRDLFNIIKDYDTENIHKVSLEIHLKAEREANSKLREMISSVFSEKFPFFNSNLEQSQNC